MGMVEVDPTVRIDAAMTVQASTYVEESGPIALWQTWSDGAVLKDTRSAPDTSSRKKSRSRQLTLSTASSVGNFLRWFDGWKSAVGVEIRASYILATRDIGAAQMLHRTSGTLKDGREVGNWGRATVCCHRSDRRWWITHEHVSLPVDFKTAKAAMDLLA